MLSSYVSPSEVQSICGRQTENVLELTSRLLDCSLRSPRSQIPSPDPVSMSELSRASYATPMKPFFPNMSRHISDGDDLPNKTLPHMIFFKRVKWRRIFPLSHGFPSLYSSPLCYALTFSTTLTFDFSHVSATDAGRCVILRPLTTCAYARVCTNELRRQACCIAPSRPSHYPPAQLF